MTAKALYGDGRTYLLPEDWKAARDEVLETARRRALSALDPGCAADNLTRYYDRDGSYAGTLFLDVTPNDPAVIEAADLYAVTTLSIELDARHGRLLLSEGTERQTSRDLLSRLDPGLSITGLDDGPESSSVILRRMYALHDWLRTLLGSDGNRWVTAAKLCARKRPNLFPVRDTLVCTFLGDGRALKSGDGWPGDFSVDMQVYAYLMTDPEVMGHLRAVREEVTQGRGIRIDEEDLRVLDAALWMTAKMSTH